MHFLKLAEKLPKFFTTKDVQKITGAQAKSAHVLCSRYIKAEIFVRLRRDLYVFKKVLEHLKWKDHLELSGLIQEHSYLSFATALSYYGILPALPNLIEASSFKRSHEASLGNKTWMYHKLPRALFTDYYEVNDPKKGHFVIASPEKALLDTLYLYSLGRYYVDLKKINLERIDFNRLLDQSAPFPPRTKKLLANLYNRGKVKKILP